jgi:hypothetical protein
MKIEKIKNIDEALKIKRHKKIEEADDGMLKFHMVYTVDGVKSEQTISAANVQKAQELIKKQYEGKSVVFLTKEEIKENLNEAYGYKVSYDELIEIQGKIDRLLRVMADSHQDEISPSSNTYHIGLPFIGTSEGYIDLQNIGQYIEDEDFDDEDYYYESLKEDLETPSTPENSEATGLSNMIITAINDEWKTIAYYNDLVELMRVEGKDEMINVIEDIANEENKHVGQLQEIMKQLSPNTMSIADGETEGSEQLHKEENPEEVEFATIDDDFGENSGFEIFM